MTPSKMGSKNHMSPQNNNNNMGSMHGLNSINLNAGLANSKTPKEQYKRMQGGMTHIQGHNSGSNSNRANGQMGSPQNQNG